MTRVLDKSFILAAAIAALSAACTTSEGGRHVTGAAGTGASGTAGTTGTAGTGNPASGTSGTTGTAGDSSAAGTAGASGSSGGGTAGAAGGGAGTAGGAGAAGTAGAAGIGSGTDGGAGASGAAGLSGGDGGAGKIPTCVTNDVAGGMNRATNQYIECDVENQAIDFDVAASYGANRKPGYDPSLTPVTVSNYGTAFSGYQVQMCHPYCYSGNLTVGVDFVPGSDMSLRGEIFFDFPTTGTNLTGLPITNAAGRASLGWIYLDGPALPAGAMVNAQMELKSTDNGLLTAMEVKKVALKTWVEFRYFPIDSTFDKTKLTHITSIGFKLTMATAGAAEWHGVIYADHFQLRM
jgi:hypothetical protein